MKKNILKIAHSAMIAFLFCFTFSCKELFSNDDTAPSLKEFTNCSSHEVSFCFSEPVKFTDAFITKWTKNDDEKDNENFSFAENVNPNQKIALLISYENDGTKVIAHSVTALTAGEEYAIYAEARDTNGNSISFYETFLGFNENPASLFISGVYILYNKKNNRHEFIELECTQSGNLAGFSLSADTKTVFVFPSCEVSKGEKIVLHLYKNENCLAENEIASDTNLSKGWYCSNETRDFWILENKKTSLLSDNRGIIVLKNESTKKFVDAFLYANDDNTDWKSSALVEVEKQLAQTGSIANESIESAFRFKKLSALAKTTKMFYKENGKWTIKELPNNN